MTAIIISHLSARWLVLVLNECTLLCSVCVSVREWWDSPTFTLKPRESLDEMGDVISCQPGVKDMGGGGASSPFPIPSAPEISVFDDITSTHTSGCANCPVYVLMFAWFNLLPGRINPVAQPQNIFSQTLNGKIVLCAFKLCEMPVLSLLGYSTDFHLLHISVYGSHEDHWSRHGQHLSKETMPMTFICDNCRCKIHSLYIYITIAQCFTTVVT